MWEQNPETGQWEWNNTVEAGDPWGFGAGPSEPPPAEPEHVYGLPGNQAPPGTYPVVGPDGTLVPSTPSVAPPTPTATPTPDPSPTPNPDGSGNNLASLLSPFPGQFQPPDKGAAVREALSFLPQLPGLELPGIPNIDPWALPSKDAVFADPSYELRRGTGERSLLNSKAAQGLARTGGTLKDLLEYNQGFASNEYGNIANRSLSGWQANTDATLRRSGMDQDRARSLYEPKFAEYMNQVGVATRAPRDAFDEAMQMFRTDADLWRDARDSAFDKLRYQTNTGLDAASR